MDSNVIKIDLDSRFEYLNEFDDSKINDRLQNYILSSISDIKKDIMLIIKFNYKIDKNDFENVKDVFNLSFNSTLNNINNEIKMMNFKNFILLLLGFCFLMIYCYLEMKDIFIFAEFFMVVSWVFFWEFVESLLFKKRKLVIEKKKYQKLLSAEFKIEYV